MTPTFWVAPPSAATVVPDVRTDTVAESLSSTLTSADPTASLIAAPDGTRLADRDSVVCSTVRSSITVTAMSLAPGVAPISQVTVAAVKSFVGEVTVAETGVSSWTVPVPLVTRDSVAVTVGVARLPSVRPAVPE